MAVVKNRGIAARARGPYLIIDRKQLTFDTDDIFEAVARMKKASDDAKLYKVKVGGEGQRVLVLLAYRKGVPASATDRTVKHAANQDQGPVEPQAFVALSF